MSYKILNFRKAESIIKDKKMTKEIKSLMEYIHDCLFGTVHKSELLRQALTEMNWRQNGDLNVLDGRKYFYKGFRNRIAIDGSFSSYEYIQDALLRLQVGFDKNKIDAGIVMITSQRSDKSRLGTTEELVSQEIEMLHPTISLPVIIVLFDLGRPGELYDGDGTVKKDLQPDNSVIDPEASDNIQADKAEDAGKVPCNSEEAAFHEAQNKKKQKSRVKSKKVLPDQAQAA